MFSALLITRLRLNKKLSIYSRGEYFKDQNEILTGPVLNEFHKLVGLNLWGVTAGFEVKPITNSYLRLSGDKFKRKMKMKKYLLQPILP